MILFFQSLHTVPYQGANKLTVDKHHSTASTSLSKPHSVCLLLYSSLTREQTLWYFNFHFGQQLHPSPAENHGFRLWGANSHPNHFTLGYKLPHLWIDEANRAASSGINRDEIRRPWNAPPTDSCLEIPSIHIMSRIGDKQQILWRTTPAWTSLTYCWQHELSSYYDCTGNRYNWNTCRHLEHISWFAQGANSRCLPLCVSEAKVTPLLSNLMVERWKVTPADEGLAHSQQGHSSSNWGLQCSCICALLCSSVQLPLIVLLSVMTTTLLQRRFSLISQCYCPGEIRRETKMTQ